MAQATSSLTYRKFVEFALEETRKHTHLAPSTLQVRNTLLELLQLLVVLMILFCMRSEYVISCSKFSLWMLVIFDENLIFL